MKIGFACKVKGSPGFERSCNFSTVTARLLRGQSEAGILNRLRNVTLENIEKLRNLINFVSQLPEPLRMLRLGGDLIPLATHRDYRRYYELDFRRYIEIELELIGQLVITNQIRLSFHPAQFVLLGTSNEAAYESSVAELDYHYWILSMIFPRRIPSTCCINIHAGARDFPADVLIQRIRGLRPSIRSILTLENDEFSWGLDRLVRFEGIVRIVPDLHHHWIHTGQYLYPDDELLTRVISSWDGTPPKLHCSMSHPQITKRDGSVIALPDDRKPDLQDLLDQGVTRSALRKHCDTPWNDPLVAYYKLFSDQFDIMVEMKHKQLASQELLTKFNQL